MKAGNSITARPLRLLRLGMLLALSLGWLGCGESLDLTVEADGSAATDATTTRDARVEDAPPPYEPPVATLPETLGRAGEYAYLREAAAVARRDGDDGWRISHSRGDTLFVSEMEWAFGHLDTTEIAADLTMPVAVDAAGDHVLWRDADGAAGIAELGSDVEPVPVGLDPRVASSGARLSIDPGDAGIRLVDQDGAEALHAVDVVPATHEIDDWALGYRAREGDGTAAVVGRLRGPSGWSGPMRFADATSGRGSRLAVMSWSDEAVVAWSEVTPEGVSAREALRISSVGPEATGPRTLVEWPLSADGAASAVAAAVIRDGSAPRAYLVAGGRRYDRGRVESALWSIEPSGEARELGTLPPVVGGGLTRPCRPVDMMGYHHRDEEDRLVVLCDAGTAALRIRTRAGQLLHASVGPIGHPVLSPSPGIACGVDRCLIGWYGDGYRVARMSRDRPAELVGEPDRNPHTTAPAVPLTDGPRFLVLSPREVYDVGTGDGVELDPPLDGYDGSPPAVARVGEGWLAAVPDRPTGIVLVRGSGTMVSGRERVATGAACADIQIAAGESSLLLVWTERDPDLCPPEGCLWQEIDGDVRAAVLEPNGSRRGPIVDVAASSNREYGPTVAARGGRYLVAWEADEAGEPIVHRSLLGRDGTVVQSASTYPEISAGRPLLVPWNAGFYLAWAAEDGIHGRRLDASGLPIVEPTSQRGFLLGEGEQLAMAPLDASRLLVVIATRTDVLWRVVRYGGEEGLE